MPGDKDSAATAEGSTGTNAQQTADSAKDMAGSTEGDRGEKAEGKKEEGQAEKKDQAKENAGGEQEKEDTGGEQTKETVGEEAKEDAGGEQEKAVGDEAKAGEEEAEEKVVETMRSVVLTGYGGTRMMKMQHRPHPPAPAEAQVLIRVHSCGMSFQDIMLRQGIVDIPPRVPFVMGWECAGIVEAVGPDTADFTVGDRVIAFTDLNAWAELVTVPVSQVYKLPDTITFQHGVCLLMHYVSAYILLFDLANLRKGQSLLLHSAAGGMGQALLQLCDTVGDVTIFATASPSKHECLQGSVTHLFSHQADYMTEIRKLCAEGVDIVLDCLSGENSNRGISLLKPLGKYIIYGSSSLVTGDTKSYISQAKSWWQMDKVSPPKLSEENRSIGGFSLRHLLFRQKGTSHVRSVMDKVLALHTQGKICPVVDSVWAFEEVGHAMQKLQQRQNVGKVLLDPTREPEIIAKVRARTMSQEGTAAEETEENAKETAEKEKDAGEKEAGEKKTGEEKQTTEKGEEGKTAESGKEKSEKEGESIQKGETTSAQDAK